MLSFCQFGAGRIGAIHAGNIAAHPTARLSIVVDTFKIIDPFILTTHAVEPIAAAADAEIADAALDTRVDGRDVNRIAAAQLGAAGRSRVRSESVVGGAGIRDST